MHPLRDQRESVNKIDVLERMRGMSSHGQYSGF